MVSLALTRRKVQLDVLAGACAQRRRVRIAAVGTAAPAGAVQTRFLALQGRNLLLEWPVGGEAATLGPATTIDAYFEHHEIRLAFRTQTHGSTQWTCPRRGPIQAWRLTTPLCIEQRQQRDHCRVALDDLEPVTARFASVDEPRVGFEAQITNVSRGGLGGKAGLRAADGVRPGSLYWANFRLPGEATPFEFVVRLVHVQPDARHGALVLGGMFCPGEDARQCCGQLDRMEQFVNRQRAARSGGASSSSFKGISPC